MTPTGDNNNFHGTECSAEYLKSLEAVREQANKVLEAGIAGNLLHFSVDLSKLSLAVDMIIELIERDYGPLDKANLAKTVSLIPPHGRWRHLGDENMKNLLAASKQGKKDAEALIILDLFVVAVLLDAGAGDQWKFQDPKTGKLFNRSEGLAIASLRMFEAGVFSEERNQMIVDSKGLLKLTESDIIKGFQVTETNPLLGVKGRLELLHKLGKVIEAKSNDFFFTKDDKIRPGNLLFYLRQQSKDNIVSINALWKVVMEGLGGLWPESRTKLDGQSLGDAWPCEAINAIVPFHKLSQWLTYSLMEPLEVIAGIKFTDVEKLTGLAEYRNGGLFIDLGIIKLHEDSRKSGMEPTMNEPAFEAHSQVIVEWRALTVALLDRVADMVRNKLSSSEEQLLLAKILEAGTWKAGREIAKKLRPVTAGPPIITISDGTLF